MTGIQRLKGLEGQTQSYTEALTRIMGRPPSLHWLVPTAVRPGDSHFVRAGGVAVCRAQLRT